jgi:hypothetical protein
VLGSLHHRHVDVAGASIHVLWKTPTLYLRGENDPGLDLERYVNGLRDAGMRNVVGRVLPSSGHFTLDE